MDVAGSRPTDEAPADRGRVTSLAIAAACRHVARIRGRPRRPFHALAYKRPVVTGIAARGADCAVRHHVGGEARGRIPVAIAALDAGDRNVGRRSVAGSRRSVVTGRTIGVRGLMDVGGAGKAQVAAANRRRVTGYAIAPVDRDVPRIGRGAVGAFGSFADKGSIVAGVAALARYGPVDHRVHGEAGGGLHVAIAALDGPAGNVGRRGLAGRRGPVVTADAVRVGCKMDIRRPKKRYGAEMATFARQRRRHMRRRFAERRDVVMAGSAIARNARVVELDREREIDRVLVAISAGRGRLDVVGALAAGDKPVMAGGAIRRGLRMIYDGDVLKRRRLMTTAALLGCRRMTWGHSRRHRAIMTSLANSRRVLELAPDVTTFAG